MGHDLLLKMAMVDDYFENVPDGKIPINRNEILAVNNV